MPSPVAIDPTFRRVSYGAEDPPATPAAGGAPPRAERQAADERLKAFIEDPMEGPPVPGSGLSCNDERDYLHFDYDHCGTESPVDPVLIRQQRTTMAPLDRADVTQAAMGDCHVLAPLAALASTPEGHAFIRNAIQEGTNDRGERVYTVTLHKVESHWFGPKTFTEVKITVDTHFAKGHADPAEPFASGQEMWTLVVEKAYAQLRGGYNAIARGGCPADVIEALTGREAERIVPNWFTSYSSERLESDLAAGKLVILETRLDLDPYTPPRLVDQHAYSVAGTEVRDGRLYVKLYNPWNIHQPDPIPCDELKKWFRRVDVGSLGPVTS
jgi:hypothetical protein